MGRWYTITYDKEKIKRREEMKAAKKKEKVKLSAQEKALKDYTGADVALATALKALDAKKRDTVIEETKALREAMANGSPLQIGMHLSIVRDIISPKFGKNAKLGPNSKEFKPWGTYLRANLAGQTRQTTFNWINAYEAADDSYDHQFILSFCKAGYAVGLRVSKESPLGKFSDVAKKLAPHRDKQMTEGEADNLVPVVVASQKQAAKAAAEKREPVTPAMIAEKAGDALVNAVKRAVIKQTGEDDRTQYAEMLEPIVLRAMEALKVTQPMTFSPKRKGQTVPPTKASATDLAIRAVAQTAKGQHIDLPATALAALATAATQAVVG